MTTKGKKGRQIKKNFYKDVETFKQLFADFNIAYKQAEQYSLKFDYEALRAMTPEFERIEKAFTEVYYLTELSETHFWDNYHHLIERLQINTNILTQTNKDLYVSLRFKDLYEKFNTLLQQIKGKK
jgi:hypothetical protein